MVDTALDLERDAAECPGSYTHSDTSSGEGECPICGQTVELDWGGSEEGARSVVFVSHPRAQARGIEG